MSNETPEAKQALQTARAAFDAYNAEVDRYNELLETRVDEISEMVIEVDSAYADLMRCHEEAEEARDAYTALCSPPTLVLPDLPVQLQDPDYECAKKAQPGAPRDVQAEIAALKARIAELEAQSR